MLIFFLSSCGNLCFIFFLKGKGTNVSWCLMCSRCFKSIFSFYCQKKYVSHVLFLNNVCTCRIKMKDFIKVMFLFQRLLKIKSSKVTSNTHHNLLNFILLSWRMAGHELWHLSSSLDFQTLKPLRLKRLKTLLKDSPPQFLRWIQYLSFCIDSQFVCPSFQPTGIVRKVNTSENKVNFTKVIFGIEGVISNSLTIADTLATKSHFEKTH